MQEVNYSHKFERDPLPLVAPIAIGPKLQGLCLPSCPSLVVSARLCDTWPAGQLAVSRLAGCSRRPHHSMPIVCRMSMVKGDDWL